MKSVHPSAVLFDFGGTLDSDGVAWKDRFRRLWCEEVNEITSAQFDPVFYAVDDALVGAIPPTFSFHDTVERIAQGLSKAMGHSDEAVGARIAKHFIEEAEERLRSNALVLRELSQRYRLGIVSNFYGNLAAICTEVGLTPSFRVIVDSACVGWLKPDPQIFQFALGELKTVPTQTVFVGDSLHRDMAGARIVGMAHIWLTPRTGGHLEPCCPNDPVIHTLGDLRGLL
jgi:HAD superfamily hydrolase (TIGR01549 family)